MDVIIIIHLKECCVVSSGTWIMRRKVGENVGSAREQNHFLLESWYFIDTFPGSARNVCMYIVPH